MSNYLPRASREVVFDGEKITISINRISMKDAMAFDSKGDRLAMMESTEALLRKYGVRFDGLMDANGEEVSIDLVFSEFYFSSLIGEASELLMSTGAIPKEIIPPLGVSSI